ncbi:MAG: polyprenyl synthetase family protein [Bacteroidales bacterium]
MRRPPELYEPVKYILSSGGKRLRPVMCLMSCNIFSDKVEQAIMPAVGLEVFHNFTLVHDDIMDGAEMRRNSPTVHSKWNTSQAILSGDVMAFIANECISQSPAHLFPAVFRVYNSIATGVCAGQQLDMDFEKTPFVSMEDYIRMVELKTAILIAGAVKIGAILGGAGDKEIESMYAFGRNLGLAFQVQDDILDAYGDPKIFGKKRGGDIIANKKTVLLIRALEQASGETLWRLQDIMAQKEFDPEKKVSAVMEIYSELDIRNHAENLANSYIDQAFASFDRLEAASSRKEPLLNLASEMVGRLR